MKNTILADTTNRLLKYKETPPKSSPHILLLQNQLSYHNPKKANSAVELQTGNNTHNLV